ncbi:27674_t:CDS:2, partial [Dentiscutata erythropus]
GYMEFDEWAIKFIDTPQFQRLKEIKQLGSAYFVYPGASHNRFEHSLGTAHLAQTFTKILKQQDTEIKDNDIKCVTLAALCHDLGPDKWKHEHGSAMMLKDLIEELRQSESDPFELETEDEDFIAALIMGKKKPQCLFDIVSNEDNSVDVDKFDYLNRDCYNLGMKSLFDSSRLMKFSCVIDGKIAYNHKECFNIYEMFHTRYSLHKKVYNHRVSRAIDYMIADALVEADPYFNFKGAIEDAKEYIKLDDSILSRIEFTDCKELETSRKIIKRIRRRDLYKLVAECSVAKQLKTMVTKLESYFAEDTSVTNEAIEDLIIEQLGLNYGKKDQNPVEKVTFYDKRKDNDKPFKITRDELSYLVPETFEEVVLRVFVRTYNETNTKELHSSSKTDFNDIWAMIFRIYIQ